MNNAKLINDLRKKAEEFLSYSKNSGIVYEALKPEIEKFESREGHNIYATRLAFEHRNHAKKDFEFSSLLAEAANELSDFDLVLEGIARQIDDEWRSKGGMNCTEICAIIRSRMSKFTGKIDYDVDQALHIMCKIVWTGIAVYWIG